MHRVKNLNFSACLLELHSVFHVLFLLVAFHSLTRIKQVICRWKAVVNTQLSRVDHFFILATILKVFHLKFIQRSSWTSCCFHVELLRRIFICSSWTSVLFSPLSQEFLKSLGPSTWTSSNKTFNLCLFILFFIQNAHRVVHELLAVINLNFYRLRENSWVFYKY